MSGLFLVLVLLQITMIIIRLCVIVCICFPTPGRRLPYGSGLGLSRCLGPGECLHSFCVIIIIGVLSMTVLLLLYRVLNLKISLGHKQGLSTSNLNQ